MMRKNITPVMSNLLHDDERKLDAIFPRVRTFDREYCKEMRDLEYYAPIIEETYDTYRDLNAIFCDPFCRENGYTA